MKRLRSTATLFVSLVAVTLIGSAGSAQTLSDAMFSVAPIRPEADGVFCLRTDEAAIVKWNGKQAALAGDSPRLKVEGGSIVRWNGDSERPTWRIELRAGRTYRVVINRSTPAGQEGAVSLSFIGEKSKVLNKPLDATAQPDVLQPLELGEVDLGAGVVFIEFRPTRWMFPFMFGRLADVRLIPLDAVHELSRPAADAMARMGIDKMPDVVALAAKDAELRHELDTLNRETRRRDFSSFSDFNQFFTFDHLPARLVEVERESKAVARQLAELRVAKAKVASDERTRLKPEERTLLDDYLYEATVVTDAQAKVYPRPSRDITEFPPTPPRKRPHAATRRTLFPVGGFDELPAQPIDEKLPIISMILQPPPDASERLVRFNERNSGAGVLELCRELQKVLITSTPGLEDFERLSLVGQSRKALEAYRNYFFAKLANPEKYGAATENILFELARDRGKGELLFRPSNFVVDKNLNKSAVAQVNKEVLVGEVGPPGAVAWVPHGLTIPASAANDGRVAQDPFWRTPAGQQARRTLEFYRFLIALPGDREEYSSGGLFPALLWSYAITGNKDHLARWCEYVDDWAMNARRDQDNFSCGVRNAMDLETQFPRCTLNLLRIVLDERPDLARDFDAATLARLLMKLVSDYTPYTIRARRAEMANWGIMGLSHQLHLGRFLHEFKAMGYFNREAWRLWNANMIQHRTPDGENIEAWDDGHNFVTLEFCEDSVPYARLPATTDRLDLISFWDDVRTDARSKLVHISPGGNYWPFWEPRQMPSRNTLRRSYRTNAVDRYPYDLIDEEPAAKSRLETLATAGHPVASSLPDRFSDLSPYASMAYLRESWRPDADYLILQNFRDRSQSQDDCSRTMYTLSKGDRILVEAHGLVVDRKPDNRYQGKLRTGGKTDYCAQAGRHVANDRFHSSPQFDFAEATQDAPYALHRRQYSDPYGLYRQAVPAGDPDPITDVTVLRQSFGLRGEGLWIVCDRIQSHSAKQREYTQFLSLPVRIETTGFADRVRLFAASGPALVEADERQHRIRTASPGFENVSIHYFAPSELKFANVLNSKREHELLKTSPLDNVQAALKAGKTPEVILKQPIRHPVSARWTGAGNQVFLAAIATRPAAFDTANVLSDDLREIEEIKSPGGVLGCRVVTRSGAQVWFQSGPEPRNRLICGPLSADAESLLAIKKADGTVSGIALGCAALEIAGKPCPVPGSNFEIAFDAAGNVLTVEPIHRPIDTVRILPGPNVFTDRIDVSFDIPTQNTGDVEFRYTLDGSEPTLESKLYSGPFALEVTTMVKVRPFRKGLKATPWNFGGTDSGKTVAAIFRKRAPLPAAADRETEAGLNYAYFEGDWPTLFSYAGIGGVLEPKSSGSVPSLLDAGDLAKIRHTDRAFAVRYYGFVNVPASGVYTFYAPEHLYTPIMDAGYDLRVFVDGEEWFPNPRLHAENTWGVPLEQGLHRLQVAYTDYRWETFRNEYWMAWQPEEMWSGVPSLEISAPGLEKQPIPAAWLRR